MDLYITNLRKSILEEERRHEYHNVPGRVAHNRLLQGGKYIHNGTYKCVLDAEDPIPCLDGKKNVVHDDQVQVILPESEIRIEKTITNMLLVSQDNGVPFSQQFLEESTILIHNNTFQCRVKATYPTQRDKNGNLVHGCKMNKSPPESGLKLVLVPRADPMPERPTPPLLDVLYTLWRFNLNNMSHSDVKVDNTLVSKEKGVVIDVGFAMPWDLFQKWPNYAHVYLKGEDKDHKNPETRFWINMNTMASVWYGYWPRCLRVCLIARKYPNRFGAISSETLRDVFDSIDKHGFVADFVRLLDLDTQASVWAQVKHKDQFYNLPWKKIPSMDKNSKWDPLRTRKFKSWHEIYKVVYAYLKHPSSRPTNLSMSYWSGQDTGGGGGGKDTIVSRSYMQSPIYPPSSFPSGNSSDLKPIPKQANHAKVEGMLRKLLPAPPTSNIDVASPLSSPEYNMSNPSNPYSPLSSPEYNPSSPLSSIDSMKSVVKDLDQFKYETAHPSASSALPYVPTSPDYAPGPSFYKNTPEFMAQKSPALSSQPSSKKRMRK